MMKKGVGFRKENRIWRFGVQLFYKIIGGRINNENVVKLYLCAYNFSFKNK